MRIPTQLQKQSPPPLHFFLTACWRITVGPPTSPRYSTLEKTGRGAGSSLSQPSADSRAPCCWDEAGLVAPPNADPSGTDCLQLQLEVAGFPNNLVFSGLPEGVGCLPFIFIVILVGAVQFGRVGLKARKRGEFSVQPRTKEK